MFNGLLTEKLYLAKYPALESFSSKCENVLESKSKPI